MKGNKTAFVLNICIFVFVAFAITWMMIGISSGPFALFYGSNFFLHLFNPILSILCFIRFEKTNRIPFRLTFVGIVPMVLYAVYYVAETLTHIRDGAIMEGYDWYGFFFAGASSALIVVPILVLIT